MAGGQQGHLALGTGTLVPVRLARGRLPELAQERVSRRGRGDPDADVHNVRAIGPGDHWVEVELGDLWQVVGQPGQPQQQICQRGRVHGRRAAVAEQQRSRADAGDQLRGVGVSQRR